jgi:hypothetical protein
LVIFRVQLLIYQRVTIKITILKPPSHHPISPSGAAGAIPPAMVDPRLRAETRQSKLLCAELLGALVPWWLVVDSTTIKMAILKWIYQHLMWIYQHLKWIFHHFKWIYMGFTTILNGCAAILSGFTCI